MKNTLKKLPFVLAFVVALFAASCTEETTIEPVKTEGDTGGIIIPPPGG